MRRRKMILSVCVCVLVLICVGLLRTENAAAETVMYGDANENGRVEASDALLVLKHVVRLESLDGQALIIADMNGDGSLTATDALEVLRTVVKLIPERIYESGKPGVSETPEASEELKTEVTEIPEASEEPEITETLTPEASANPEESEEPEETKTPEITEMPGEPTASPKPTRRPRESAEPTEMPAGGTMDVSDKNAWKLWNSYEEMPYYNAAIDQEIPYLVPYIASDNETGACVIVCPGGGYASENTSVSGVESVATELRFEGITAFALSYRTEPYTYKAMISDVLRAVRFVRYYHESLGIDPDNVTVMGFSAGGHLALMGMEHYADEDIELTGDAIDVWSAKPDAGVLGYAVVSMMDEYGHETSRLNFLGEENADNEELKQKYSGELGVTDDTPPMFIWHCKPDKAVSYKSSELLAETLAAHDVDYELHIYNYGAHGIGLAYGYMDAEQWFLDCVEWIKAWD